MKRDLTKGSIKGHLIPMSFQMSLGMLSIFAMNMTDTYFIGQLGTIPLAAMSFTLPVIMFFNAIAMGLSTGITSILSRTTGERDNHRLQALATDSLLLAVSIVVPIVGIAYLVHDSIFIHLGASEEIRYYIDEYMYTWYLGFPFIIIPMVGNGAIRSSGDTSTAALIMFVAAISNIILDPILMFGHFGFPEFGMKGAAIASVCSRIITLFASLYVLKFKLDMISSLGLRLSRFINSTKKILNLSFPLILSNAVAPLSIFFLTRLYAQIGPEAVAAFGVVGRFEMLIVLGVTSLAIAMSPFVGQNYGAYKINRINEALTIGYKFSFFYVGVISFICFIFKAQISSLFSPDEVVRSYVELFFVMVPFSYIFMGHDYIVRQSLTSLGFSIQATVLFIVKMFILLLPISYLMGQYFSIKGLFAAEVITHLLSGLLSVYLMKRVMTKL